MVSNPRTDTLPPGAATRPLYGDARVQLKPPTPTSDYVDGAWWPRTNDLPAELPPLLRKLSERLGPIALVAYHRNAWHPAPAEVEVEGRVVRLEGFSADQPHTVVVVGTDGRGVGLLIVPTDVTSAAAREALTTASRPSITGDSPNEADASAARSLAEVATRLARHEGRANERRTADIARWVDEAARQFTHAPIQVFVPILVEHIVRGRMTEPSPSR